MGKEKNYCIEETALSPIPQSQRMSWLSLAFVQAGICVCVPAFLLGALLAEGMPIIPAIISGSLGYLLVVIGMIIIGFMGTDLGIASCTACEAGFGKRGARIIVSTIFAINMIGWFGINNQVCGEAFSNAIKDMTGFYIPVTASSIIWGIIMLLTAIYGVSALEKLDKISIPLLMVIMVVGTYLAFKIYGVSGLDKDSNYTMSFFSGVALSFNFTAVGTITAADYTRFQKSRIDTVKSTFYGVFPMGVITLVLGILLTKISAEYDIGMVLIKVGMPLLGVIALVISTWTTNSSNAYSAGLNLVMAFNIKDTKRREATLISGIIGIILCALGILDEIENVLSWLSYAVCPIGGILLADYWIVGRGKPENFKPIEGFNWAGILTWAASIPLAVLTKIEFLGIFIALIIYLVIEKFIPSSSRPLNNKKEALNEKIFKEDIIRILIGCSLLGTGGGGSLEEGITMINQYFEEDDYIELIQLSEIPDDKYIATPYSCGAPDAKSDPQFKNLKKVTSIPSILALKAIEKYIDEKVFAVTTTELGGSNSAEAFCAAKAMGIPLVDADPAGRSVPELQHSTYFLNNVSIAPLSVATTFGDTIVIENVVNDYRAEDIVRAIAVASDNMVGVCDHVHKAKKLKNALIPQMITYADTIGSIITQALNIEKKPCDYIINQLTNKLKGKKLFEGIINDFSCETREGFNFGEILLQGLHENQDDYFKINFKNENIIAYHNDKVVAMVPDLICMLGDNGYPITTPNFKKGDTINIVALPAPKEWLTKEGLECLGPSHFNLNVDYKPFS